MATDPTAETMIDASSGVQQFMQELDIRLDYRHDAGPTCAVRLGFGGPVDVGILAVLVDIIGGSLVLRHGDPCGISTTDMTVHGLHRLHGPGVIEASARVVSVSANRGTVEVGLAVDGRPARAAATVAFKRWPGVDIPAPAETSFGHAAVTVPRPLWQRAGAEQDLDAGTATVELRHELSNHVGALQGGVTASLLEAAALTRCEPTTELRSMALTYLAQARRGPFRATARRTGPDADVIVVEAIDLGSDDRPVALAVFDTTTESSGDRP